jgi:integrase
MITDQVQPPDELLSKLQPWQIELIAKSRSLAKMAVRIYRNSGSYVTVANYVKDVSGLCKWLGQTPDEAIETKRDWPETVNDFLDHYTVELGNANTSSRTVVASVKKWLETNNAISSKDLAWQKLDLPKNIRAESEVIPTKKDLRTVLAGGRIRERAMVTMAISSGLRRGSLLALRFRDVDLTREVPILRPRKETTKGRARFFTFMTPEAKEALLLYKKEREMRGEAITPDSYVFTVDRPLGHPYMVGQNAALNWINMVKKAGLQEVGRKWSSMHFHTLCKFYKSWASLSGMNTEVVEFTMGHRSSLPQVYCVGDAENVPQEVIEKLEAEYRKAIPALTVMSDTEKVKELETKLEEQARKLSEQEKQLRENEILFEEEKATEKAREDALQKQVDVLTDRFEARIKKLEANKS